MYYYMMSNYNVNDNGAKSVCVTLMLAVVAHASKLSPYIIPNRKMMPYEATAGRNHWQMPTLLTGCQWCGTDGQGCT